MGEEHTYVTWPAACRVFVAFQVQFVINVLFKFFLAAWLVLLFF